MPLPMDEDAFKSRVIAAAALYGWRCVHYRPARTAAGWRTPVEGDGGAPDLWLARAGRVLGAELKSDTGDLGPGQQEWLDALGPLGVLWRPRDWPTVLDELQRGTA